MKTQFKVAFLFTGLLPISCEQAEKPDKLVLDVSAVANKKPEQVVEILGQPDSSYTQTIVSKKIFTQLYDREKHGIEIQYPEGRATDIVINNPMPLPYEPGTLSAFGITPKGPTSFVPNAAMRWDNVKGFDMVSFYVVHMYDKDSVDNYRIFFKAK